MKTFDIEYIFESMETKINQELIKFLSSRIDIEEKKIHFNTKLAGDLGVYGLDALYLFDDFFDVFKIQNIENFDSDLHIDGSVDFSFSFKDKIKNILIKERRKYLTPDVTIGHLNKVIEKGKWFNASIMLENGKCNKEKNMKMHFCLTCSAKARITLKSTHIWD